MTERDKEVQELRRTVKRLEEENARLKNQIAILMNWDPAWEVKHGQA